MRWVACALLALAAAGNPGDVQMTGQQQHSVGLRTARAETRAITEPVRAAGVVGFDQGRVALIHPPAQGRVRRLLAAPGDAVQPGQALAEFDLPSLLTMQADLVTAEANLREATAGTGVARAALHRADILAADGSMARAEVEQRRLMLAQAVAAADGARARAAALRTEVARLSPGRTPGTAQIVSPIRGVVVSVGATPGELLDQAAGMFTVADLSSVLVTAQVPEAGATLVGTGDPAYLSAPAGGGRVWQGRIVTLGAALDPQARTLPARIELANADGALRAGMFLDVTFTTEAGRQGIVVPAAAVQTIGARHVAFTPGADGHFAVHDVKLGVQRADWVEVREGLRAGDTVVTQGSFELKSIMQQDLLGGDG